LPARASTSKALSVPSRDIRSASIMAGRPNPDESSAGSFPARRTLHEPDRLDAHPSQDQ
jgi:hypothetical protein